jgi:Ca2+-binding RTX toxin-like protein
MITVNTGTISGTNYAYISVSNEDTVDTIVNRGDMVGEISLFHGNDIYRGGKGSLIGEIFGGDGNDRINCGDDDDLIHGGNGKDRLRGGAGEDVFYFDTSINGFSNVDRILDFSIADDMIGINALTFGLVDISALGSMFAVNKTGKADADDIVIYQSTTGKLFFDHDSKGGDDAVLFAILGKNLKLTADNFEVV